MKNKRKKKKSKMILNICIFLTILSFVFWGIYLFRSYNPGKITISAPFNLGTYEFDRAILSEKELDISWKLYIQLTTRKAAIPLEEDDIITEVYDSWYELFKSTREYLLEMPASELEGNKNAQQIVKLSIEVLNEGLRPHLTKWQGKYRRWYDVAIADDKYKDLTPQEIQKLYPEYDELSKDVKKVNKNLIDYAEQLKKFSHEEPSSPTSKFIAKIKDFILKNNGR
ncbi:hypothetical protein [Bacillus toyonensis]|uniref:hypothetical protein n=1 Tax=Bacillus toyonensis TaxID=155322 RepID=UPI000B43C3AD|nr:hypothetical protein [Bacillus toyonensis]MED3202433.1 hypothetical protein [Bacillus toyonensis]OTX05442.1 hypothetical protein BK712_17645 [Bacillus thuringiensis serovar seoulensis]